VYKRGSIPQIVITTIIYRYS